MKVFTCTSFAGFFPVGTSAVIVAPDEKSARNLLKVKLKKVGLICRRDEVLEELSLIESKAIILHDGDY